MSKKEKHAAIPQRGDGLSRRSFLKTMGLGTTATLASGALVSNLAGCSSPNEGTQAKPVSTGGLDDFEYEVFETDVLIIGSGNAASATAWSASKEDVKIMLVDKGPLHLSGSTNMCWGGFGEIFDIETDIPLSEYMICASILAPYGNYLINRQLLRNAINQYDESARDYENRNRAATMINHGQYLVNRDESGDIVTYHERMSLQQYYRRELDGILAKKIISTADQTMITDLIIEDGKCCGAIGLHLPTGRLRVFRAKSVVTATAGCTTVFGYRTVRAYSSASPDSTADVEMALFRHGYGIAESEYAQYDVKTVEPSGLACGFGASLDCDAQDGEAIKDNNGDPALDPNDEKAFDRDYFCRYLGKLVAEQSTDEEEAKLYIDYSVHEIRGNDTHQYELLKKFGVDPSKDVIEASFNMYEHGGAPVVDENIMTEVEGLFWVRGAGTIGEPGGAWLMGNQMFGNYAGVKASEYAKGISSLRGFDWQLVKNEYIRLADMRTNDKENGIRPFEIRHKIQRAFHPAFSPYRTPEALEKAITEIERIRKEELPFQVVTDSSSSFNREWKDAIENFNIINIAEMSLKATLARKESRGQYTRPDYPEKDEENWACLLVCRNEDGEMVFEKQDLGPRVE